MRTEWPTQNRHISLWSLGIMTHLWRKQLGKDANFLMTIPAGDHFWNKSQHKPLIIAIVLPFAYVENYRVPWIARGLEKPEALRSDLEAGFKIVAGRDPAQFPNMDGELCGMWKDPERRSRTLLLQFLDWAGSFPPYGGVWCGECYQEFQYNPYLRLQGVEVEPDDTESDLLQEEKDQERYRSASNGDHLMKVPF